MYRYACWDKNCIKLFTWNQDGERIIVDREYSPYLYVESDRGKYKSIFGTNLEKKTFKSPWYRAQYIKDSHIKRLFENLKPAQQFLIDEYEGLSDSPEFSKNPLKICFFDIETDPLPFNEFPNPEQARASINLVTIHNSLDNKYTTYGTKPFTGTLPEELKCEYIYCETESDLLEGFLRYIEEDHPDILSAWNLNFFDMPYICNRIEKILGESHINRLAPLGIMTKLPSVTKDNPPRDYIKYSAPGMTIVDYIDVYKKFKIKKQETYKLDFIGELEVGQKKLAYDGTIADFMTKDWNKFVLYNIRDVELLVRIDKKTNYFGLFRLLGYIGLTNFEDSLGVIAYSTGAVTQLAHKRGQKMFTPIREVLEGKNEGGYVSCHPGLTKDLFSLDFTSLYPSIIRQLQISPEALVGTFEEDEDGNVIVTLDSRKQYKLPKEKFDLFVKSKNLIKSGANVLFKQDEPSIYGTYMTNLFADRKAARKELFEKEKLLGIVNKLIIKRENG